MKQLPFQVAHHWITRLTQLPHPITINHIPPIAEEFGWEPTDYPSAFLYQHGSDTPIILTPFDEETQEVFSVTFRLASNLSKKLPVSITIADLYNQYTQQAIQAWGMPTDYTCNATSFIWKLHNHAYLELYLRPNEAVFSFDRTNPNTPD